MTNFDHLVSDRAIIHLCYGLIRDERRKIPLTKWRADDWRLRLNYEHWELMRLAAAGAGPGYTPLVEDYRHGQNRFCDIPIELYHPRDLDTPRLVKWSSYREEAEV